MKLPRFYIFISALIFILYFWNHSAEQLQFDRARIIDGEYYRLLTCHLVHYSFQQVVVDCIFLMLPGFFVELCYDFKKTVLIFISSAMVNSVAMLIDSTCSFYRGISGIGIALTAVTGILFWNNSNSNKPLLVALVIYFMGKTILESYGITADLGGLPLGITVAWLSHASGFAVGILLGLTLKPSKNLDTDLFRHA